MTNIATHGGQGQAIARIRNGADLILLLMKTQQTDATFRDYTTLDAALTAGGGASNVEANFTNYARKVIANVDVTATYDTTNNRWDSDFPDPVWLNAGGALNNTLVKLIVCSDGASDALRYILTSHDFSVTTDGQNLTGQVAAAGFYRAA